MNSNIEKKKRSFHFIFPIMIDFFIGKNDKCENHKVYISVDSVEYNDESSDSTNDNLIVAITSRNKIKECSLDDLMKYSGNKPSSKHVWQFKYKDIYHSSFVVILTECKDNQQFNVIGGIEIKLEAFQHNIVTKHKFVLRSRNRNLTPASITLSVHICDNGAKQFDAPEIHKITDDYEIFHDPSMMHRKN